MSSPARAAHDRAMGTILDFLLVFSASEKRMAQIVVNEFTTAHAAAALWLEEQHGMTMGVENLYNLIEFWPDALLIRLGTSPQIPPTEWYAATEFNPHHLIAYFEQQAPATD